jgi:hypothetical protein
MEPLKYILNERGEREAVIVPIAEWERLHPQPVVKPKLTLERLEEIRQQLEGVFPDNYAEEVRKEWDREWDT